MNELADGRTVGKGRVADAVQRERLGDADHSAQAARLHLSRKVRDWQDRWAVEADARLSMYCSEQSSHVAEWAEGLWTYQIAALRTGIVEYPALRETVENACILADKVVDEARRELTLIVANHLSVETGAGRARASADFGVQDVLAAGRGVAPLVAAAALLIKLPALATTTSVALFGLVTTSTVSVPILAAGAVGAGALSYLGFVNIDEMRRVQQQAVRESVDKVIEARVLAPPGANGDDQSLLAKLQSGFASAAKDVMREVA